MNTTRKLITVIIWQTFSKRPTRGILSVVLHGIPCQFRLRTSGCLNWIVMAVFMYPLNQRSLKTETHFLAVLHTVICGIKMVLQFQGSLCSNLFPSDSGYYSVTVLDSAPDVCPATSASVFIAVPTGIGNISENKNEFTIYPNPATDQLFVNAHANNSEGVKSLEIYNLLGDLVLRMALHDGINKIRLNKEWQSGIYLCKFLLDNHL